MVAQARYTHSGPLPAPEQLAQYNAIAPDAAERIIQMAVDQANHRRELEKVVIKAGARDSLLGLVFGFIIGLSGMAGSVYCIAKGYQLGGGAIGVGSLAGLVGVFVYGSRQKRQEREFKYRADIQNR